jgi:Flp pilus assembly protein TadD
MSARHLLTRRLLLAVLAPALALLALEGALRVGGYGFTPRLLIKDPRTGQRVANPHYGRLYFPRALARRPEPVWLADPKPADEYRLFILGESAALGMPDPAFGFGRQLEVMLAGTFTDRRVVVVNLAMTAINSHALPGLAAEALDAGADALVVLAGNNEVVGPFGPGTVFDGDQPGRATVRAKLWLRGTRTGQLLAALRERKGSPGTPAAWGGLAMFLDHRVAADDPRLARTYASFRANLADAVDQAARRHVPVLLCTVPVNLRDCAPLGDGPDGPASQAFLRGRARLEAGDRAGAQAELQRACDLDPLRFRADSSINAVVRHLGLATPGVTLVDAEQAFAAAGPPGSDLFHEHVHFTFAGDYALATLVANAWAQLNRHRWPAVSAAAVAQALAYTAGDEVRVRAEMAAMTARPPFTAQLDHAADLARRRAEVEQAQARARTERPTRAARYAEAVQTRPHDFRLRLNQARALQESGAPAAAVMQAWSWVAQRLPHDLDAQVQLALARARSGQREAGLAELERLARAHRDAPEPVKARADLLLEFGRFAEAAAIYRDLLQRHPHRPGVHMNLGVACMRLGRLEEAERAYRAALEDGRDAALLMNLGTLLLKQHRYAEARPVLAEARAAGSEETSLLNNLGVAQLALGEFAAAAEQFAAALARNPQHPNAARLRGESLIRSGRVRDGLAHLRTVLERGFHPAAAAAVAIALAAAPSPATRNPTEARAIVQRLQQGTGTRFAELAEAAAAADAAEGRFAEAAGQAGAAADLYAAIGQPARASQLRERQARYQAGQPAWLPAEPADGGVTRPPDG